MRTFVTVRNGKRYPIVNAPFKMSTDKRNRKYTGHVYLDLDRGEWMDVDTHRPTRDLGYQVLREYETLDVLARNNIFDALYVILCNPERIDFFPTKGELIKWYMQERNARVSYARNRKKERKYETM